MIDFLKECGISEFEIKQIEEVNSSANLYNLNCNEFDVVKMIDYLSEIGIKNIDNLLRYKIDLFFTSFEKFKFKFDKFDKKNIDLINKDYTVIDKIMIREDFL